MISKSNHVPTFMARLMLAQQGIRAPQIGSQQQRLMIAQQHSQQGPWFDTILGQADEPCRPHDNHEP